MTSGVTKPTRGEWVMAAVALVILCAMVVASVKGWI